VPSSCAVRGCNSPFALGTPRLSFHAQSPQPGGSKLHCRLCAGGTCQCDVYCELVGDCCLVGTRAPATAGCTPGQ
jgi:hypothetical protein